ncbi:hypothetical protein T492DRAFT_1085292, partial [Pavlovales sp. CCMP2436]
LHPNAFVVKVFLRVWYIGRGVRCYLGVPAVTMGNHTGKRSSFYFEKSSAQLLHTHTHTSK